MGGPPVWQGPGTGHLPPPGREPGASCREPSARYAADRRWSPTARVRMLVWSVLLLAAALAASTAATYVLLIQRADHRVTDELAHEAAEFRTARDNADASERPGSVLAVLRLAASRAAPESNVTFLGLIDGHVAVTSAAPPLAPLAADGSLVARWARSTPSASGSANSAAGPIRYITLSLRLPGDPAHELRTPITIVQGNLDTLTIRSAEDAETLGVVADELQRMTRLVDELLLLARSRQPDFLHSQPTDITDLTLGLLAKIETLDNRPWSIGTTAQGSCELDRQRITQAILQLAANAARHTPASEPVELSSAWDGGTLLLSVADRGPGIPAGEHARIFDRFTRLDTQRPDSTGLGLSIVAAIAAAHGGRADAHDRPGGGAIFHLHIPCDDRHGDTNHDRQTGAST